MHGGQPAQAEIAPAPLGFGLRVNGVLAQLGAVIDGHGSTTLQTRCGPVRTVEHLLAALLIAGIDDARVTVTGGEVPILDGAARGWFAQARAHGGEATPIVIKRRVRVTDGQAWAEVAPAKRLSLDVSVDFPQIGGQRVRVSDLTGLLDARTFGFRSDLHVLHAQGRARGAHLANTLVYDDGPMLPPRSPDEPARHKALDLIGDLALLGSPLCARVRVHRGTHRLHHRLVEAILDSRP